MPNNEGTLITSPIRPHGSGDEFPVAFANELKGGYYSVSTVEDRDAIPMERRMEGMMCHVISTYKFYVLSAGIDNANWQEVAIGGGSGQGASGYSGFSGMDGFSGYSGFSGESVPLVSSNRAIVSDDEGGIIASDVTDVEIQSLSGISGPIQSQLDDRLKVDGSNSMIGSLNMNITSGFSGFSGVSGRVSTILQKSRFSGILNDYDQVQLVTKVPDGSGWYLDCIQLSLDIPI